MTSGRLLMVLVLQLLFTVLGVAGQHPTRPRAPGVAFELTPDYGVAAIHLKGGTFVPIARVQGSPAYQAFMRKKSASAKAEDSTLCRLLAPALDRLPSAFGIDIDTCRDADVVSTKALLATLKTAVESYLGTNICFASLSLDDIGDQHQIDVAQEALQALHLRQVLPTVRGDKPVVVAHKPDASPGLDETPSIILALDYSLHWFNVGLYTSSEGYVDPVDPLVSGRKIDEEHQLDALRDALRYLFDHPPPEVNLVKDIRHLVVYGDDSNNSALHDLLAEVLDADLVRDARVSSSVFDGPSYTAAVMYETMDTVDFEMDVRSPSCQRRSKLYGDHSEL
ncbi:hypothetical protein CC86DRAFT_472278 [Ophiobolus disseminans]|uniref:Uncharacterized protein n=1 Tax=Ophiobolus disseminans TaxID=1469910 RepID=A0A6A6ZFR8_9PLEO|nr:hypothetical protein CC86DRAFT_472278 [Ophiobolus disseminans]